MRLDDPFERFFYEYECINGRDGAEVKKLKAALNSAAREIRSRQ